MAYVLLFLWVIAPIFCLCTLADSCPGPVTSKNGDKICGPLPKQPVVLPVDFRIMFSCNYETSGRRPYWAVTRETDSSSEVEPFLSNDVSRCWYNLCVTTSYTSSSNTGGEASTVCNITVAYQELDVRLQIVCGLTLLDNLQSPLKENFTSNTQVEIYTFGMASSLKVSLIDGEVSLTWSPPKISLGFKGSITFDFTITVFNSVNSSSVCSIVTRELSVNQTQLLDSCELENNTEYLWSVSAAVDEREGKAVMSNDTFNVSLEYVLSKTSSPIFSKWPTGSRLTSTQSSKFLVSSNSSLSSWPSTVSSDHPVSTSMLPSPNGKNESTLWHYVLVIAFSLLFIIIFGIVCVIDWRKKVKQRNVLPVYVHQSSTVRVRRQYFELPPINSSSASSVSLHQKSRITTEVAEKVLELKATSELPMLVSSSQVYVEKNCMYESKGEIDMSKCDEQKRDCFVHQIGNKEKEDNLKERTVFVVPQSTKGDPVVGIGVNTCPEYEDSMAVEEDLNHTGLSEHVNTRTNMADLGFLHDKHPCTVNETPLHNGHVYYKAEDAPRDGGNSTNPLNQEKGSNISRDLDENPAANELDYVTSPSLGDQIQSQDYRPTLRRQISNQYGGDLVYANRGPHLPQQSK